MDRIYEKIFNSIELESLWNCNGGYVDRECCSWYHQNWMFLRRLHLVSNPMWHEKFYKLAIKTLKCANKDVLVLGTADFSMPFLCYEAGIEKLDICDICKTPLNICDRIADMYSLNWNTYIGDIKNGLNKKYDIIIDDAFLTRFDYDDKRYVLQKISDALNPDGVYITTIRKGWNNGKAVIPTSQQKKDFIRKSLINAKVENMDLTMIEKAASSYINKMVSFPIKDEDSLSRLVEGVFTIENCTAVSVPGECESSIYYQVIMKKLK